MSPKGIINCVLVLVHFFHQLFKEKNDNDFHQKIKFLLVGNMKKKTKLPFAFGISFNQLFEHKKYVK